MIDSKYAFRTTLIGSSALTALVPATRITQAWPKKDVVFPLIVFREIDNYTVDEDYQDDQPKSETSVMQVDIFCKPESSSTAIAQAVDNALVAELWNRDYSEDFVEPDSYLTHKVIRYSKRLTTY
jgi:hypothetical protein